MVAFDKFRGDRLPHPQKSGRFWRVLENYRSRILPINSRIPLETSLRYVLTSRPRRLILAVMDYWLLFVGFSLAYWSLVPSHFSQPLTEYTSALYFSVVAGTTLGFGDITPTGGGSRSLAAAHTLMSLLFVVTIIAFTLNLLPRAIELSNTQDTDV